MARLPLVSPLERALWLRAQPYLEGLSARVTAALAQHTEERAFSRGEEIWAAGEPPEQIYFLSSGAVRTTYEGARAFDLSAPGGIGFVEHLGGSGAPPAVRTLEETIALSIEVGTVLQLMEDEFDLYMTFARSLSRAAMAELATHSPSERPEPGFRADAQRKRFGTLDLVQRIARAREAPFFHGSNLTVMTQLLRFQEPRTLQPGEALWEQGAPVESMALLLDGTLATSCAEGESEERAGAMLGAWELFAYETRQRATRATCAARVLEIDRSLFMDVLEDHSEFAIDFLSKLSRRLIDLRFGLEGRER